MLQARSTENLRRHGPHLILKSDASDKVGGTYPRAQVTSDSEISVAELIKIVNGDSEKYISKTSMADNNETVEEQGNRSLSPGTERILQIFRSS